MSILSPWRFHHQALVELKILDVIKRKDKDNLHNVIHMKEYFYFRNHLCISFELLGLVYNKPFGGSKFWFIYFAFFFFLQCIFL